jgi:CxxC motif-containing protein (DUF1111 family)
MTMIASAFLRNWRRIVLGAVGVTAVGVAWGLSPGVPVLRAPRAGVEAKAVGLTLFRHEWAPNDPMAKGDGLGPVFNAKSCAECHSQGGVGGGGDNSHNVLVFEAFPVPGRPKVTNGVVHHFAVEERYKERRKALREFFPIVRNGLEVNTGCQIVKQDFDPVQTESVNTPALFGGGWVDRISDRAIHHASLVESASKFGRELKGDFDGAVPGRARVLPDGRVGKFGWKAQFASLEEFVASACANELGLGNPKMEQAMPRVRGFALKEVERDLTQGQFRALVAFVDTLPRPSQVLPADLDGRRRAERGKSVFSEVGCASCHVPDVGGVAGVYSDFLLHRLNDRTVGRSGYRETPPVPLPEEEPQPEEWKTPPLWGVADSAPYFHDGGSPTLEAAIARHHGDAEGVMLRYEQLTPPDRASLMSFLRTLKAPTSAVPAGPEPSGRLAMAR